MSAALKPCPVCQSDTRKVIYLGLPGRLCTNDQCNCLDGIASYAPIVPTPTDSGFVFAFLTYEGSYLGALWHWLIHGWSEAA